MAGMFCSLEEAAKILDTTPEQVKRLVEEGKLRQFSDGGNVIYKIDEVEALKAEMSAAEEEATIEQQEEEVLLEPAEEETSVLGESLEGSTQMAGEQLVEAEDGQAEEVSEQKAEEEEPVLAEVGEDEGKDATAKDATSLEGDISIADTAITQEGINVLEDTTEAGYDLAEDTLAETKAMDSGESLEEIEEDVNLDSFGSGSGLLDLSLQADDTSLGGILDEIYAPEQEQQGQEPVAEEAVAEEVAAEADMLSDEGLVAQQPAATVVPGYVEPEPDASSNVFGVMLFLPFVVVLYTAIVASAGLFDFMPSVLEVTRSYVLYILGGLFVVAVILMAMGFMAGRPATAKVKKEKKPKVKKEKKK